MKKSKLTALIISAAMAMQTMPVFTGIASAAEIIPNTLNFEDIQAGTSAADITGITLDKGMATVEKDEYGSNDVKISSGAILKFNLDSSMECKHTVIEYKYRSVEHTSNGDLYEFGTLIGQNEQRILKSRIYNQHLNICKGTSTNVDNNFNIDSALSASESYVTMKYVVKHEDKLVDVYKDGELVRSDIPYFHSVDSAPVMLLFNIAYSTASTFYIDDISVKKIAKTATEWDFENDTAVSEISGLTATGTTAIAEDETTGNKYLVASPSSKVNFNFPATTGDLVKISYTMTLPEALTADASHTNDFGSVRSGTTRALRTSRAFTGWVYYLKNNSGGGVAKSMPAGTYNVEYTLNMNTKTTSVLYKR